MPEYKFVHVERGFCIVMTQKRKTKAAFKGGRVRVIIARRSPLAPDEMGSILDVIDCGYRNQPEGREITLRTWKEWKQRNEQRYNEIKKECRRLAGKARKQLRSMAVDLQGEE